MSIGGRSFRPQVAQPYVINGGRIHRVRQIAHGPVSMPLCNFTASIVEEVILDNGAEQSLFGS